VSEEKIVGLVVWICDHPVQFGVYVAFRLL
jgi:hypothetical protein